MATIFTLLKILGVGVILVRCICVASRMSRRDWYGHPLHFIAISASYTLVSGGAVGLLLGFHASPWMLLAGVVLWVLFDRRRLSC